MTNSVRGLEKRIEERLATLRAQREQVIARANRQVATIDGAIAVLEELSRPDGEAEQEEDNDG